MDIRVRRIYYTAFILLFVILAPLLLFYAEGYRLDFEHNKIVRTGSLVVHSSPTRASVYLNDELQRERTNNVFEYLRPGDYDVRIEKDGYIARTYQVSIQSRKSTFLENVTLFPADLSERTVIQGVSWAAQDAARKRLLLGIEDGTKTELQTIDTTRSDTDPGLKIVGNISSTGLKAQNWDTRLSRVILVDQDNMLWMVNLDSSEIISLDATFPTQQLTQVVFHPKENNRFYGLDRNGDVWDLNSENQVATLLETGPYRTLTQFNERIWLVKPDGTVSERSIEVGSQVVDVTQYAAAASEAEWFSTDEALILSTADNIAVFVIESGRIKITTANMLDSRAHFFVQDRGKILAHDSVSIVNIDALQEQSSVLTRLSTVIYDAVFSKSARDAIIATDSGVVTLDRVRTHSYQPITLIPDRTLKELFMNSSQDRLFGIDEIGTVFQYSL